ncbi:MAG TPA: ribosome-associated translation inhibitor RaiA [Kineosporiaceae bacterium]|nr:ribosome-associated translation inhibitor RaiA [Kineosporiaceae bacterium]
MEIVITGRRTEVPDRFRRIAEEKLGKIGQLAPRAHRVDVELSYERNPRQSQTSQKVEITVRDKGPVIRAEASADDMLAALDLAFGKLLERLRRTRDRRKVHHGRQTPPSVRVPAAAEVAAAVARTVPGAVAELDGAAGSDHDEGLEDSPVVIRTKDHAAIPMTLDQALYEMELVGHDFFLFVDADSGLPSVVYRRRGWNYGLIRLVAGAEIEERIPASLHS